MTTEHNDETYRKNIRNYLIARALAVQVDTKGNLMSLAVLSEDFYVEFLNILLDLNLRNENDTEQNISGIDLLDRDHRVAVQVSVTCAPQSIRKKIQGSLDKFDKPDDSLWQFYFVPITEKSPDLTKGFRLPEGLAFNIKNDVLDISQIMKRAKGIDKLRALSELVDKYGKTLPNQTENIFANIKEDLWLASKRHFCNSHARGARFESLNIIDRLLPRGKSLPPSFLTRGTDAEGSEAPVSELIDRAKGHVAIIGVGGIGKTTFLQRLMEDAFGSKGREAPNPGAPVPFFVELNRCPEHISSWYDDSLRKTNFITRYIGQLLENHLSIDAVSNETLWAVEKELQRSSEDGPQYLLLLDGFNEVGASASVRRPLSQEIATLSKYPNVRIITTSRETQGAYYAAEFENIRVSGVSKEEILYHLRNNGVAESDIGEIAQNESLMRCLEIPLYLCMFTAEGFNTGELLPETTGEILYNFFHKKSRFYNIRKRIEEVGTISLSEHSVAFIIDFILPYIGWEFEKLDTFYMNESDFRKTITDAFHQTESLIAAQNTNPFSDFDYQSEPIREAIASFLSSSGEIDTTQVISLAYDNLGIVYRDKIDEGAFKDRIRYAFSHHHFRDYFSAIWDVQLLFLLQCIPPFAFSKKSEDGLDKSIQYYIDAFYWTHNKVQFISEILMEYRNKPCLDPASQNWFLPPAQCDEQQALAKVLDYCRELRASNIQSQCLLQNSLSAILFGRKDYSGLDLSGLDLQNISFFNKRCSRIGKTRTLAACFDNSILSDYCFEPEEHQEPVIEYAYSSNRCFTIDNDGIVKCWDVDSGRLEKTIESGRTNDGPDYAINGFMKISYDGKWLATKVHEINEKENYLAINLYNLDNLDHLPKVLCPPQHHTLISSFAFSPDCQSVFVLCDGKSLYSINVETGNAILFGNYNLYNQNTLFAGADTQDLFILSAEYNALDFENTYRYVPETEYDEEPEEWNEDSDDDEELEGIPCSIEGISADNRRIRTLCEFLGAPGTAPVVSFSDRTQCFIFYDYSDNTIKRFDIKANAVTPILGELLAKKLEAPCFIYPHPSHAGEFYIVYRDECFIADVLARPSGNILMSYPISGARKLIPNAGDDDSFAFSAVASPSSNHLILCNDENTYEWDVEKDIIERKYNTVLYESVGLFKNSQLKQYTLVHAHNGISVFEGSPLKLVFQHCVFESGYAIRQVAFHEEKNIMALSLVRPDHEKVAVLDLSTGEERIVFSSLDLGETIESLSFNENGDRLLVTTQYKCMEVHAINPRTESVLVAISEQNERFAGGHYCGEEVEIAVVEHEKNGVPSVEPRCDYYSKTMEDEADKYSRKWSYIIPELCEQDYQFFLHFHEDFGVGGSNDKQGIQSYWITRGFFTKEIPHTSRYFAPRCFIWNGDNQIPVEKTISSELLFVRHKHELTNRYHVGKGRCGYSLMYLSSDGSEAVITDDGTCLLVIQNPHDVSWEEIQRRFKEKFAEVPPYTMWSFAVPCDHGNLLGCYDGFRLTCASGKDNSLMDEVPYYPGISIFDCSFLGAAVGEDVREVIEANGGVI